MYINSVQKMKFSNININEVLMCNSYKISDRSVDRSEYDSWCFF